MLRDCTNEEMKKGYRLGYREHGQDQFATNGFPKEGSAFQFSKNFVKLIYAQEVLGLKVNFSRKPRRLTDGRKKKETGNVINSSGRLRDEKKKETTIVINSSSDSDWEPESKKVKAKRSVPSTEFLDVYVDRNWTQEQVESDLASRLYTLKEWGLAKKFLDPAEYALLNKLKQEVESASKLKEVESASKLKDVESASKVELVESASKVELVESPSSREDWELSEALHPPTTILPVDNTMFFDGRVTNAVFVGGELFLHMEMEKDENPGARVFSFGSSARAIDPELIWSCNNTRDVKIHLFQHKGSLKRVELHVQIEVVRTEIRTSGCLIKLYTFDYSNRSWQEEQITGCQGSFRNGCSSPARWWAC
ncbi:hypothetical protein R1sor_007672 [Riccia sorocarpa]|uniref:Uncharacterized protein n=1 Tax=Riccia sorocarpa TaxID=122646 RepID=A0ABD3HSX4_9MARC